MKPTPLFFLGFSNAEGDFLQSLSAESSALYDILYPCVEKGLFQVEREESMQTEELVAALRRYKDRMVVFHFAGHAGSDVLHLEDQEADASAVAQLLSGQADTLRLVFLNGCATRPQVDQLHKLGIKAVIATARPVEDDRASYFAQEFYQALAGQGFTLREAFNHARNALALRFQQPANLYKLAGADREGKDPFRGILTMMDSSAQSFEWGLYAPVDADLDWTIHEPFLSFAALQQASRQRRQELQEGAFRYLKIEDALLPEAENKDKPALIPINVRLGEEFLSLESAVYRLWKQKPAHALLIGKGGMGKTVSMVQLWDTFLQKAPGRQSPVPLYLALDEINEWEGSRKNNYLDEQLAHYYQAVNLRELLQNADPGPAPRILLLLDGIHYVNPDKLHSLVEDIGQWATQNSTVQIIVTAQDDLRQKEPFQHWGDLFPLVELQPLSNQEISNYLGKGVSLSAELFKLLSNPMMLALYKTSSSQQGGKGFIQDITQSGELLCNVERMTRLNLSERQKNNPGELAFQRFILEHVLPEIAWAMYQAGSTSVHSKDPALLNLRSLLDRIIPELLNEEFFDTFDWEFDRYLDERRFELSPRRMVNQVIRDVCSEKLVLLIEENQNFRFLHNLFRDYFAARRLLNAMDRALTHSAIPPDFRSTRIDDALCRIIGQIEGEHRLNPFLQHLHPEWANTPRKPNRIHRLLDICRGNFREQDTGYCVHNLLRIVLLSRGDLAGVDLQLLDLRKVNLSNVPLVRKGKQPLHAQLFGARATRQTFTGENTPLALAFTRISPDGQRVLFASKTGEVQEWDLASGICIFADRVKTEQEHLTQENSNAFPYLYLADIQDIRYHADGKLLFLRYPEGIYTWNPGEEPFLQAFPDPAPFDVLTAPPGTADEKTMKKIARIQPLQGLYLQGLPLGSLHPDSQLGEEDVKILRKHGAVFSDKDAQIRLRLLR